MQATDATRQLCASAFLGGSLFRDNLLDLTDRTLRAQAIELGIDLQLVLSVCRFAARRELIYDLSRCATLSLLGASLLLAFGESFLAPLIFFTLFLATSVLLERQKSRMELLSFIPFFRKSNFDPEAITKIFRIRQSQADLARTTEQNLIIFSEFDPFDQFGMELANWSFSVPIDKPPESAAETQPVAFTIPRLYGEIAAAIRKFDRPQTEIKEVFCVRGTEISGDACILPDRFTSPIPYLNTVDADRYRASESQRVRCFLWLSTTDERGECVSSHLVRCSFWGNHLFVEVTRHLMLPLDEQYRKIDNDEISEYDFKSSLLAGPFLALFAPLALMSELLKRSRQRRDRSRRRRVVSAGIYNYGARSVRAQHSGQLFSHYFQRSDSDLFAKATDTQLINCVIDFLEEHNVDVSDLRTRRVTILNNGVIVERGDVNAESLAVGEGAQIRITRTKPSGAP
jgi:hypothetical protein